MNDAMYVLQVLPGFSVGQETGAQSQVSMLRQKFTKINGKNFLASHLKKTKQTVHSSTLKADVNFLPTKQSGTENSILIQICLSSLSTYTPVKECPHKSCFPKKQSKKYVI